MSEELKELLKGAVLRELEVLFTNYANAVKNKAIDRTKPFIDQGVESYANELASEEIIRFINQLRNEIEPIQSVKKSYK
jgi:hypothetical protein